MKKSVMIEEIKQKILNRVKFHAPVVFDSFVDKNILLRHGVDINLPIFKYEKPISKQLFKAFVEAKKEEKFNLVVMAQNVGTLSKKMLESCENLVVYEPEKVPKTFLEMINKLNINYNSASNYKVEYKDKFFKVCGQILNPQYKDFSLKQKLEFDQIIVSYDEFVLNGSNFFCMIENCSANKKMVEIELNLPLKKGYYFFKKGRNSLAVHNLLTHEITWLNFCARNAQFCFSEVDGLENSVFSCVNVKAKILLGGSGKKFVFFNFGSECFTLKKLPQIKRFKALALQKMCEIFDVRVKTKNESFNQFFNFVLPRRIWLNWLNGQSDALLEQKYLARRRLFVVGKEKISFVPFKQIGLKEIGVFNGQYYKKIFVVKGDEKFLKVGTAAFYNINGVTNHSLKSKEPISLCFGF